MIEYPSIINSSRAPRKPCIAFEKLDGSNIRIKYTTKRGFELFGSRTQLIDETHPHLGGAIPSFRNTYEQFLTDYFRREFRNVREVIVFGEYWGDSSFAGIHDPKDTTLRFIMFDVLIGHKEQKFMLPQEFVKAFEQKVPTPRFVYQGNLNDEFIEDVRSNKFGLGEGVVCKGTERSGAFRGGVWMAKIKTRTYLDRIFTRYGNEGLKNFGE